MSHNLISYALPLTYLVRIFLSQSVTSVSIVTFDPFLFAFIHFHVYLNISPYHSATTFFFLLLKLFFFSISKIYLVRNGAGVEGCEPHIA